MRRAFILATLTCILFAVAGKPPGKSRSDTGRPDDAGAKKFDGNPDKVTLCHKDKVTISVGAPAKPAHLRHRDSIGAC